MIRLKNINKTYYKGNTVIKALDNVNLEINEGEIYGIIGFSGAGKSTLVRCINLLEHPDKGGVVEVNGTDLMTLKDKDLRQIRSKIGMIFQHFNLMPSRTVLDNVLFPLQHKGIKKEEQLKRAKELLELVDLSERINNYPAELSGGQKQRVAIARALASNPSILLCDEATSALDPTTTNEILDLLKKINAKLNLTIVVIAHQLNVIKALCHKVAIMEHGKVVEQGDILQIFSNPTSEVTKRFLKAGTTLSKADIIVRDHLASLNLKKGEHFVRLTFKGATVNEPLIATINQKYGVVMNILLADMELIEGNPIGGTVGVFSGDEAKIKEAIEYLKTCNVNVEVLAHAWFIK